jgi:hypothetical protein
MPIEVGVWRNAASGVQQELAEVDNNASLDLYFGADAPSRAENHWIKTIPGKGWFVYFRIYGPEGPASDGSWRLPDIPEGRLKKAGSSPAPPPLIAGRPLRFAEHDDFRRFSFRFGPTPAKPASAAAPDPLFPALQGRGKAWAPALRLGEAVQ